MRAFELSKSLSGSNVATAVPSRTSGMTVALFVMIAFHVCASRDRGGYIFLDLSMIFGEKICKSGDFGAY